MNLDKIKPEYKTPPVPQNFFHIGGSWNNGFVIKQKHDEYGIENEFVWIPVCTLPADGTSGSAVKNGQFGARDYGYSGKTYGAVTQELKAQEKNVKRHGGFYISRYPISLNEGGEPVSAAKHIPMTMVSRLSAVNIAHRYKGGPCADGHLPYAAEMDSMLCWLLMSDKLTEREVKEAVAVRDTRLPGRGPVSYTGLKYDEKNGLFDVINNVDEWTQESFDEPAAAGCGHGCSFPQTARCYFRPYACYSYTGFRIALLLKDEI